MSQVTSGTLKTYSSFCNSKLNSVSDTRWTASAHTDHCESFYSYVNSNLFSAFYPSMFTGTDCLSLSEHNCNLAGFDDVASDLYVLLYPCMAKLEEFCDFIACLSNSIAATLDIKITIKVR